MKPATAASLPFEFGGNTHVGRRDHNEDSFLIDRALGLAVVADGVGGHQCGELASAITCEVIQRETAAGADLCAAIQRANAGVLAAVRSGRGKAGMASTVVAARLAAGGYEIAWLGDSRAYLWDGKLHLLSRDHSFVEQQVMSGRITRDDARTHPRRNVILPAVGAGSGAREIGTNRGLLATGACLLLCSDGLTEPLDNARLCALLDAGGNAQTLSQRLVDAACQAGGSDNITALLIRATAQAGNAGGAPDTVVWMYDPRTGRCDEPGTMNAPTDL